MRRSAAPSRLHPPAKRPRFHPVYKDGVNSPLEANLTSLRLDGTQNQLYACKPMVNHADRISLPCSQKLSAGFRPPVSSKTLPVKSTVQCRRPLTAVSNPVPAPAPTPTPVLSTCQHISNTSDNVAYGYFNVMWCKASKKKHKKWEGDAVLVTHGRTAVLHDMDGKEIGRATGYKATELSSLKEDETLFIGGKEIQVMSVISEENYKSGKCFMLECVSVAEQPSSVFPVKSFSKPFMNPCIGGPNGASSKRPGVVDVVTRHDPTAPGALVMPRPSPSHQWEHNKKELPVVDVVVDPYLSTHLRPHQREGVSFLYECVMGMRGYKGSGAILADDMGLGKTLQCIAVLWTLLRQGPYGRKAVIKKAIIITPGSLVKNWKQEFKKWLGPERLYTFAVGQDNRVEEFTKTVCPVLIISYEMFVRSAELLSSLNFDLIICDEGHRLKNTTIKTTSLIMALPTRRRVVLTGTPVQNDLQEFYSIVEFVNPGVLGSSAGFRCVYEDPIVRAREPSATPQEIQIGEKRAAELARLTKLFTLRRTQDINNKYLLPKVDIVVFCQPSPLQLKLYRKLLDSPLIRSCLSGSCSGSPHLVCIAALKKLCNHPVLLYRNAEEAAENSACELDEELVSIYQNLLPVFPVTFNPAHPDLEDSGKLHTLAALLGSLYSEGPRERAVLVSNHTKTLDILQGFCTKQGYKFLRLDGQTPTAQRQAIVQRFNNQYAQEFVFLLSSKAGGVGLNLIGASRLILYDIDWNPANDLQAMARVWRDGQKKRVFIYRLITTGSLEEKIYQRQISKQGLSGAVVDVKERGDVQFAQEDLRDLFSLNENTRCETHDLLSCTCDNSDPADQKKDQITQPASHRACQLGQTSSSVKKKRNLTMDELLDWKHTNSHPTTYPPEWHLVAAGDTVSYLFWNETAGGNNPRTELNH